VVPISQHQPDIARIILISRPLSGAGVGHIAPGIGVEEAEIGRHSRQRVIPCWRVVQSGFPRMNEYSQAALDRTPPPDVGVLIN
jgi:hypothetical protein